MAEYPNLLLIVPVGAYLLWRWRTGATGGAGTAAPDRAGLLAFLVGWAVPVCLLLGYDWAAFGRPWATSYTYHYYFEWARRLDTTYVTPLPRGLRGLLLGDARTTGLLAVTPALALAPWGLLILARRDRTGRARAALLAGLVLAILVPTALHRTYYGGGSRDTRYLLAIVPALCAPLALWLDAVARARSPVLRLGGALLMLGLGCWGLARAYLSLFSMFGHPAVERPPLEALAILRDHWREPAFVAPGLWLTPYFLVLAVPLAGLAWLAWAGWSLPASCGGVSRCPGRRGRGSSGPAAG